MLDELGRRCDIQVMRSFVPLCFGLTFTLVGGCTKNEGTTLEASAAAGPAATEGPNLDALERDLSAAQHVEIEFRITSSGAVETDLSGTLEWHAGADFHLDAKGSFAGAVQDLELDGDAEQLRVLAAGQEVAAGPRPAALVEAVVLGLTRQGLLHNLAMLSAGQPPERADGGIGEWLGTRDPALGAVERVGEREGRPLAFGILVGGEDVGGAVLWFDAAGAPFERHQTVHFEEGDMEVVERYSRWVVE